MKGIIFNIQRFSIDDGPGIRTTVFLKGCNMRCRWCHNPESQEMVPEYMTYENKSRKKEICGRDMDVQEVFCEIEKDRKYYEASGGGVTFSGGEPLLQVEFLKGILRRCKEAGIHTAIETAANVSWANFEQILPYTDCFLCDVKCLDNERHIWGTGVSNKLILSNVYKLMEQEKKIIFRTPVIPGYNDDEIEKIAKMVRGYEYELLPYHMLGKGKYDALRRQYTAEDVQEPSEKLMRHLRYIIEKSREDNVK